VGQGDGLFLIYRAYFLFERGSVSIVLFGLAKRSRAVYILFHDKNTVEEETKRLPYLLAHYQIVFVVSFPIESLLYRGSDCDCCEYHI
jgi:hypothetical protein